MGSPFDAAKCAITDLVSDRHGGPTNSQYEYGGSCNSTVEGAEEDVAVLLLAVLLGE